MIHFAVQQLQAQRDALILSHRRQLTQANRTVFLGFFVGHSTPVAGHHDYIGRLGRRGPFDILPGLADQLLVILLAVETHGDRHRTRRHGGYQPILLHCRPIRMIEQIDALQSHANGILAQIVQAHLVVAPAAHRLLYPAIALAARLIH